MIGDIMKIDRLRMGTDGKGVSTLVCFFDCPLHCKYCINDHCHEAAKHEPDIRRAAFTPRELIEVLEKDSIYYLMTGGGIVFGGGEPLLQSPFIHEVCKLADPGWQVRVETSLNVPWRLVESIIGDIDEWIVDIKDMNKEIYEKYTRVENRYVEQNMRRILEKAKNASMRIRVPRIKNYNTDEDIAASVERIRSRFGIEPEVFDYIIPS